MQCRPVSQLPHQRSRPLSDVHGDRRAAETFRRSSCAQMIQCGPDSDSDVACGLIRPGYILLKFDLGQSPVALAAPP